MELFTADNLQRLREGDLATLAAFDAHGVLLGPDETPERLADRVLELNRSIAELRQELAREGKLAFLDTTFPRADLIPPEVFAAARSRTRALYGFETDWVPGFFTNYRMGMLHAGCCYYSYQDFFALFILRKAFQNRERWLIYSRTELMAHELCHVAHLAFQSLNYEEIFAYQTAESSFRRWVGGVLRTPADTYLILAALLTMVGAQVLNVSLRPPEAWNSFPMPLVFGGAIATIGAVVVRYLVYLGRFRRARLRLGELFGASQALPVLFRCADRELGELSRLRDEAAAREWLASRRAGALRWQVIAHRFPPVGEAGPS